MLSRLSVWAALAACVVAVVAPLRAEPPAEGLVRRVYPVADLVTPLPEVKSAATAKCAKADKGDKSRPTREDWLIEQLLNTVQPASWAAHDGAGTVDYFPMAACLIVNQTPAVQKQVAERLAELRKQQDTEVALEVRLVTVSEDVFERIGIDFNTEAVADPGQKAAVQAAIPLCGPMLPQAIAPAVKARFLNDRQVVQFLESATADPHTNIMQMPRMTLSNGQEGSIQIDPSGRPRLCTTPETAPCSPAYRMTASPRVSADRRYVRVALNLDQTEQLPANEMSSCCIATTASIPDGGTVLISGLKKVNVVRRECCPPVVSRIPYVNRLFTNVGYGREHQLEFVLVTPRIIIQEEQEVQSAQQVAQPAQNDGYNLVHSVDPLGDNLRQELKKCWPDNDLISEAVLVPVMVESAPSPQLDVLAELLKAYDNACVEGNRAEAKKFARAALVIDPTCFCKKR